MTDNSPQNKAPASDSAPAPADAWARYRDRADYGAKRQTASLAMSLIVHVALVSIAVLLWTIFRSPPQEPERRGGIVLTEVGEMDQPVFLDQEDFVEEQLEQQLQAAQAASAPSAPAIDIPEPSDLPGPVIATSDPSATEMAEDSLVDKPSNQYEISDADLEAIAKEQRRIKARQPKGNPISISVFDGTKLTGRRFVFILDRSQSMGSRGLGVLSQAQTELSSAINQLQANHSFQIVAYHSKTITISERKLLPATAENKALVKPFLQRLAAFGSTEHTYGISAGMAFRPDAVVLLTDGGYPELTETEMRRVRKAAGGAEFHCIQFGLGPRQDNVNFMTKLAGQSKGTYRYIDVRSWDK